MWKLMGKYKYRKPLHWMLSKKSAFQVEYDGNKVRYINYNFLPQSTPNKVEGVCHELAMHLHNELTAALGHKYEFALILGNGPEYFFDAGSGHCYLVAFPNRRHEGLKLFAPTDKVVGFKPLPKDCLVIDPSFRVMESTNDTRYTFKETFRCKTARLTGERDTVHEFIGRPSNYEQSHLVFTPTMPLGYLSELKIAPEKIADLDGKDPKDVLVSFTLLKHDNVPSEIPSVFLTVQSDARKNNVFVGNTKSLLEGLPAMNPLRRFCQKLQKDISRFKQP
jgi:hypothetical protein